MNFRKGRIGTRLGVGFGVVVGLMVVLSAIGLGSMRSTNGKLERIVKVNNVAIEQANDALVAITDVAKSMLAISATKDNSVLAEERKKLAADRERYRTAMDRLEKLKAPVKIKYPLLRSIKDVFSGFFATL